MADGRDQDRNEPATPYKLADARKRAQVARSTELVSLGVFAAALAYLDWRGLSMLQQQFTADRRLLSIAGSAHDPQGPGLWRLAQEALQHSLWLLVPLWLLLMVAAVAGSLTQTGGVFSLHPFKPDWRRLHPGEGLARMVSVRMLFDTARAVAKLAALTLVTALALRSLLPQFHQIAAASPSAFLQLLVADAVSAGYKVALALAVIAAIDLAFTRREFQRKMRMSRREVREEARHREGDPRIRSRLRELRRQMLERSRSVRRTAQADLVVTNPTHYAVALRYEHGRMAAPLVVSKGAGVVAAAMRRIAHRHGVPVVVRPALARALYAQAPIDASLPQAFYRDVAQLMIWLLAMRRARQAAPLAAEPQA